MTIRRHSFFGERISRTVKYTETESHTEYYGFDNADRATHHLSFAGASTRYTYEYEDALTQTTDEADLDYLL